MNTNPHTSTRYFRSIVAGLQRKPQYEGTVPADEKARRRAKNRLARAARRTQRGARA